MTDKAVEIASSLRPQLAKTLTKTSPAMDAVLASPEWICQRKWDGMRALFHILPDRTLIFSRTGQDLRPQFPDLLWLHEAFKAPCILDGEILAFKAGDQEDLELLQYRISDKKAKRRDEIPVGVRFFDVLAAKVGADADQSFDGAGNILSDRLAVLKILLADAELSQLYCEPITHLPPSHWEGIVAKKANSLYKCGKRNSEWLKYKATHRATLYAYGLTEGEGSRADSFGALQVRDANAIHRGQVGSGFSDTQIEEILDLYSDGEEFLIEVEYRFISKTGLLVNTAFKGIRHDKDEADAL